MQDEQAYQDARKRVEARIGFFIHLAVYVVVNAILIVIDLTTSPNELWFYWPLLGWGIGIAFHAAKVFLPERCAACIDRWVERETEKELRRRQGA